MLDSSQDIGVFISNHEVWYRYFTTNHLSEIIIDHSVVPHRPTLSHIITLIMLSNTSNLCSIAKGTDNYLYQIQLQTLLGNVCEGNFCLMIFFCFITFRLTLIVVHDCEAKPRMGQGCPIHAPPNPINRHISVKTLPSASSGM